MQSHGGAQHARRIAVVLAVVLLAIVLVAAMVAFQPQVETADAQPTGDDYRPLSPRRVLDTRTGNGAPQGKVGPKGVITLRVTGRGGVPASGVAAVALNVTVTEPTAPSYITVWPGGEPRPHASNLNMTAGRTVPNLVISKVGADGTVRLYNHLGDTHLVADVVGWYPDGADYRSLSPRRVLDTRTGNGAPQGKLGAKRLIELRVTGRGGVPASGVGAVVLNLTATEPTAGTFVTAWPHGEYRPVASSLNVDPGDTFANLVIAKVGAGGKVVLFNNAGDTHLVADVVGWFAGTTPPPLSDLGSIRLKATPVASADQPTAMATREGSSALYVAEKTGDVVEIDATPRTILDIPPGQLSAGGEQGLLGLAFSPSGNRLYVNTTDAGGDTALLEYRMRPNGTADPASRRVVLRIDQPASNHNGGALAFGPDGYLYVATGDGGGGGDPFGNGQNIGSILGGILRIDPSTPSAGRGYSVPASNPFVGRPGADALWVIGARNPWRISFDAATGDLWVADVGQNAVEEIDLLRTDLGRGRGANLGWPILEGSRPFRGGPTPANYVAPIHEYPHTRGRSVTGGYVYRGDDIPALRGTYLYADFFTARLWGIRGGTRVETVDFGVALPGGTVSSFGEGPDGEIYALSLSGTISRIDPA